jgi:hypothetical protein
VASLVRVYDVRQDDRTIKATQRTTLETDGGLALLNGLLCYSDEWFRAVETGEVQSTVLDGVISRVFMSGHNDFPEFELEANGERTRWARVVSKPYVRNGDHLYQVGCNLRLMYVEHPWKPGQAASRILGTHARLVISIDILPAVLAGL